MRVQEWSQYLVQRERSLAYLDLSGAEGKPFIFKGRTVEEQLFYIFFAIRGIVFGAIDQYNQE